MQKSKFTEAPTDHHISKRVFYHMQQDGLRKVDLARLTGRSLSTIHTSFAIGRFSPNLTRSIEDALAFLGLEYPGEAGHEG